MKKLQDRTIWLLLIVTAVSVIETAVGECEFCLLCAAIGMLATVLCHYGWDLWSSRLIASQHTGTLYMYSFDHILYMCIAPTHACCCLLVPPSFLLLRLHKQRTAQMQRPTTIQWWCQWVVPTHHTTQ